LIADADYEYFAAPMVSADATLMVSVWSNDGDGALR